MGDKKDCCRIKSILKKYLSNNLKLELSEDKTKITHSSNKARFLGYDISVRRSNATRKRSYGIVQRTLNNTIELAMPLKEKIHGFVISKGIAIQDKSGKIKACSRKSLIRNTPLEIITTFNSQTRGICNYYSMASNYNKLDFFCYLMEYSCLKTLADKGKTTMAKTLSKLRMGKTWGISYETKSGKKIMYMVRLKDLRKNRKTITIAT